MPLLLAQLALLAVTVLALVAHAVVEQRRPEVALARLRGRSREAGSRLVMAELALTVLLGVPLGALVALAGGEVLRRFVMPRGVPIELRWPLALAAGVAVVASLLAVYAAARPVLREPVASLLRRIPPSVAKGLGVLDVVVAVVAAVAVVGLVSGDVDGPSALLTPVLLALAVGLVGAWLLRRAAAGAGRRALARGHLATGLAALSLARRPALRHVLVVVTTATALATFAANAVVVGDRNRAARAELELGAPAVLETNATEPGSPRRRGRRAATWNNDVWRRPSWSSGHATPPPCPPCSFAPTRRAASAMPRRRVGPPTSPPSSLRSSRACSSATAS